MLSAKLIAFLLSVRALFMPCCPGEEATDNLRYSATPYARMDAALAESSGLEHAAGGGFWVIRDSGGPSVLYKISAEGKIVEELVLNIPNSDWESLARDRLGNIYIGDFGNNSNRRQDLAIYKINPVTEAVETILFHWEDQQAFPPPKDSLNYDCEAFFWHGGQLHLFTKSRGDLLVRHYLLPDTAGTYAAELLETVPVNGLVTAADISPDGATVALLTYGQIYFFATAAPNKQLSRLIRCVRVPWAGQSEAVLFLRNNSLLLSNETGKLYFLEL